jgi:hypothetical protein
MERILEYMVSRWYRVPRTVVCGIWLVLLVGVVNCEEPAGSLTNLNITIVKVRTTEDSTVRAEAAQHLIELTSKIKPSVVDDTTLADLVSLLDTWDDSVRVPVAMSLGNLGPRAKAAAASLLEILPEVDCLSVDVPPGPIIRDALMRIGVTPPICPPCETNVEPAVWKQRIRDAIVTVRTSNSSVARAKAATHLAYFTGFLDPKEIDNDTIADLVSLLDNGEGPVLAGVAASLGNAGPHARAAAPRLQQLLGGIDCQPAKAWEAQTIRESIGRIGLKTRPPRCAHQAK